MPAGVQIESGKCQLSVVVLSVVLAIIVVVVVVGIVLAVAILWLRLVEPGS